MPDRTAAEGFIDAYRRTFESFDVDAVVAHFAFPLQVTSEGGEAVTVVSVPDAGAWRPQVERIVGAYRLLGVTGATVEALRVADVTPRVAHAIVRWGLVTADGSPVYAFTASYTLVDSPDRTRITALAQDETPKLMAAVARAKGA